MSDDTTPAYRPLTHAERGALGGAASNKAKGFGSPAVLAKALATREAKRAVVKSITDQFDKPADPDLKPYKAKPFVSALADRDEEPQVIE